MTMQMVQEQSKCAGDAGEFDLLDLYPEECPPFLVRAWLDCLMWTLGSDKPDFLKMFASETGTHAPMPAKSPKEPYRGHDRPGDRLHAIGADADVPGVLCPLVQRECVGRWN